MFSQLFIKHPRFVPLCLPSGNQTWPWKIACKYQPWRFFWGKWSINGWFSIAIFVLFQDSILLGSPRPLDPSKTMLVPFPAVLRLENVACRESLLRRNLIRCLIFLSMYIYIYMCVCVLYVYYIYIYIYTYIMYKCMCVCMCVCDTFIFLRYAYILNMYPFAFVWVCVSPTSRTCALEKCVFVCGATCYPLGSAHIFLRCPALSVAPNPATKITNGKIPWTRS